MTEKPKQTAADIRFESRDWKCPKCGKGISHASGEFRWNGHAWEHDHGYPLGHVRMVQVPNYSSKECEP